MEEKINKNNDPACDCEGDCACEDVLIEEMLYHTDDKIDTLISLLLKKGVISEDELNKEFEGLYSEDKENKKN